MWIEAFLARTELVAEVVKEFLKEIISRFGLPGSLSSGNGSTCTSQVKKGKTSDLGIKGPNTQPGDLLCQGKQRNPIRP